MARSDYQPLPSLSAPPVHKQLKPVEKSIARNKISATNSTNYLIELIGKSQKNKPNSFSKTVPPKKTIELPIYENEPYILYAHLRSKDNNSRSSFMSSGIKDSEEY